MNKFFPISAPDISDLEKRYVAEAVESTWISSTGRFVDRFEDNFARLTGNRFCLSASNGTTALHLALLALGIKAGDEVIVPSFTYIASVNAIKYCGAVPVFADIETDSWCLSPVSIVQKISPRTKAILVVHLYGQPAEMEVIHKICKEHSLYLIEDAAEAIFAEYKNQSIGCLSDIAVFSFYGNKLISSGEGGAVVTNEEDLYLRAKLFRGQGMDPNKRYYFPIVGYNYRLTNVACAILCAQLERIKSIMANRWRIYYQYQEQLKHIPFIELQQILADRKRSPWLFTMIIRDNNTYSRDGLSEYLMRHKIETRPTFYPIHHMPPYLDEALDLELKNTLKIAYNGISLPTYSSLSDSDIRHICKHIENYFEMK